MLSRQFLSTATRGGRGIRGRKHHFSSLLPSQKQNRQLQQFNLQHLKQQQHNHNHSSNNKSVIRNFHQTSKQEILPIVAVGTLFVIGRYSYKALNRMDEEWEEYQWSLRQYEIQKLKEEEADKPTTIGIDVGTMYMKVSTFEGNRPEIISTNQGDRYRFAGLYNQGEENGVTNHLIGRSAMEKFFYTPTTTTTTKKEEEPTLDDGVTLPYHQFQSPSSSTEKAVSALQTLVNPILTETTDRMSSTNENKDGVVALRSVLTLPPDIYMNHGQNLSKTDIFSDDNSTVIIPNPVAAIWGAQILDLIPTPTSKDEMETFSTLVIDVGGLSTAISLVKQDRVMSTVTLQNVGGETLVQQLVDTILNEADDDTLTNDPMTLMLVQGAARSSTLELINKNQSKVHIPFLFMGRNSDNPHFEMNISKNVLNQSTTDYIIKSIVPELINPTDGNAVLSSSLPPPTDLNYLLLSAITKVLEDGNELPTNIQYVLFNGGGSKHSIFEGVFHEAMNTLMGTATGSNKLIIPELSLRAELTSMGAASLLPNYKYSYDDGLYRQNDN